MLQSYSLDSTLKKCLKKILLILLVASLTTSAKIFPISNDLLSFFKYADKSFEYSDTNTKLNLARGSWYFLKKHSRLEFHCDDVGYLDFNSQIQRFYSTLYLNAPKRIIAFPLNKDQFGLTQPYLDSTMIKSYDDKDLVTIYTSQSGVDLREAFVNNEEFQEAMNLDSEERVNIFKVGWNKLPYVDPQITGDMNLNSFNNKWAIFEGFGSKIYSQMLSHNDKYNQMQNHLLTEIPQTFIYQSLARIMRALYFDKMEMIDYQSLSDDDFARAIAYEPNIKRDLTILVKLDTSNSDLLIQNGIAMKDILMPLAESIAQLYLQSNMTPYLDYYFGTLNPDIKNLSLLYNFRKTRRLTFPVNPKDYALNRSMWSFVITKMKQMQKSPDDKDERIVNFAKLYVETKDKYIAHFKNIFEIFYEKMAFRLKDRGNKTQIKLDLKYLESAEVTTYFYLTGQAKKLQSHPELTQNMYNPENDEQIKQRFLQMVDTKANVLFSDALLREGMNMALNFYEFRSWGTKLPEDPMWSLLSMAPYADKNFDDFKSEMNWVRTMLVVNGEMSYDHARDLQFMNFKDLDLFSFENRLLI